MNFFYLDENPKKCAECHFDVHVRKMVVEYSQMLSTAHRLLDGRMYIEEKTSKNGKKYRIRRWKLSEHNDEFYVATHYNHPTSIWVRESLGNYLLMLDVLRKLHEQYFIRFKKHNKSKNIFELLETPPKNIYDDIVCDPPLAMPNHYNSMPVIDAYRAYYMNEKRRLFKYTNVNQPEWYK